MKNLASYTTPLAIQCPTYINVSQMNDGHVRVIVRTNGAQTCSEIYLPRDEARKLLTDALEALA